MEARKVVPSGSDSRTRRFLAVSDFEFDGRDDILWREGSTGQLIVWIMDGAFVSAEMYPGFVDGSWSVKAIAHDRGF